MLQLKSTAGLAPHFFYLASRTGVDSWGGGSLHLHYLMAQVTVFPVGFSTHYRMRAYTPRGLHVFILYVCVQAAWLTVDQFGSERLGGP